ncbi:MAG: EamA family transporter, partial [Treponema sp.]|nr:EamA family transporter [Treponema sp.]
KKAMEKNTVMEVLVIYTLLSFVFVIPQAPQAGGLEPIYFLWIAIKSFSIFLAWICSFRSLKKLPVSVYGVLDLSRILFATSLGILVLGETIATFQGIGLIFVCCGLVLLKFKPAFLKKLFHVDESPITLTPDTVVKSDETTEISSNCIQNNTLVKQEKSVNFYIFLAFLSCMLNAVSGFLDKVLMKDISSSQLQFWYMLFLIAYYLIYVLIFRVKISPTVLKNGWVWLLAIMFVIGDKALFIANGDPASKITIMTLIKQAGCLVTILGGKFVFKEKNTGYRMFCACIIIVGIVMGVI